MSRALNRLGRLAARRPWAVIGAWLAMSVLVIGASAGFGRELSDSLEVPGLDSQRAADLQERAGTGRDGLTAQVVLTPRAPGRTIDETPELRAAVADVKSRVAALPNVIDTSDGLDVSPDGTVAVLRVQYPPSGELSVADLDRLKAVVDSDGPGSPLQVEAGGALFFQFEEPAAGLAELVGLVVAAVVLFVAFGSLIAMGLPILMALLGIAVGFSALSLITIVVDVPSWSTVIGAMVGLGVGIDYALFLVTRHREFLAQGSSVEEAAGKATATAGQAVVFAGGTVVIAILGLLVADIPFLTNGGFAISLIVLLMVVGAVTLVPALLGLAGQRINSRRVRRAAPGSRPAVSARWLRWGSHVSRRAWPYAVGVTVLLLAVAAPVLGLRLGFPDDGTQPANTTQRQAYDLVAQGFGPGSNGPLVVAVDISRDDTVIAPLAAAVADDPGVASVALPLVDRDAGVATVIAFPTTAPQDEATYDTVQRLRAEVFPAVLDDSPATAHVGGQTATWADVGAKVTDRLPWFIGAVVLLSVVLLTVVFRSIVVPVKAALLNLLSTGAAFGVLVMVFQWGWGMALIGLESTIPVIPIIPMLMFAILFGISMDYEVFLLSRVREHFLRFGNSDLSVIHGLAGTARVITSAALIMISVFLGFAFGDDPSAKMMGLGLATAIFIDATIVRLVLVPATMTLLGNANWWLPAWLDRILPGIDIEDGVGPAHPSVGQRADTADAASSVNDADSAERSLTP